MAKILLSIKPQYVKAILSGEKKYEYRRVKPRRAVEKIYIYCTGEQKVVGIADVDGYWEERPEQLWKDTRHASGMSGADFFEYFRGCERGIAYRIIKARRYLIPRTLGYFGLRRPPQSFTYLDGGERR